MFLVPYNTDAPLYHFPWATIGLIVTNVVVGFASFLTYDEIAMWDYFILDFTTINPIQWLTTNFMHADPVHLIGNMFFLWGFGLVVEGKLGWKRFLLIYLTIGFVYGAVIQISMFVLGSDSRALGASAAIFGLMGIAVIWAPKNDLNCFLWMGIFSRRLTIPIMVFGGIYFAIQMLFLFLRGFQMSSEMLHVAGLAVGLPFGIVMLKKDMVDCEGWDYFTLYHSDRETRKRKQTQHRTRRAAEKSAEAREQREKDQSRIELALRNALQSKNDGAACAIFEKYAAEFHRGELLSDNDCLSLASAMQREQKWEAAIPLMAIVLRRQPPERTTKVRLSLAKMLITQTEQPKQGLVVLKKLQVDQLSDKYKIAVEKLTRMAKQEIANGAIEFDIHDW